MNTRVLIVAAGLACMSIVPAGAWVRLPATTPIVEADWQSPVTLPRRFRNHCAYDSFRGRGYCSDHCGFDYQFYYCSPESFGCCRVGFGYCDWNGLLRCHP
jgi:hypothetical protein